MKVIGMGEKKTPNPFIAACDKFIYLEILKADDLPEEGSKLTVTKTQKETVAKTNLKVIKLISATISDAADEEGWAFLGDVGTLLLKKQPNFDSRNYGFEKLTPLIDSIGKFDIETRDSHKGRNKLIFVRNKPT